MSAAGLGRVCSVWEPEQSHHGHLAIPLVSSEGFGGLLASSNTFQRIQTGGMPGEIAGRKTVISTV